MEYKEGSIGRVFVLKIDHEDNFIECIKDVVKKENIKSAFLFMIGAIKDASLVTGPKDLTLPPEHLWKHIRDEAMELQATGTVFLKDNEPAIHIHATVGNENCINIGCLRENSKAFIVIEVLVIEIKGIECGKLHNKKFNANLLTFFS